MSDKKGEKKEIEQATCSLTSMMARDPTTLAMGYVLATLGVFISDAFMGGKLLYSKLTKVPLPLFMLGMMVSRTLWVKSVKFISQGGQLSQSLIENTDLSGKVIVITGGTAGIGKATAIQLLKWGAKVIIGFRDQDKATRVQTEMINESGATTESLYILPLILDDLKSVKEFAKKVLAEFPNIDMLINNAGIMAPAYGSLNADNLDIQFSTNHMGHFFLTKLLLDSIKQSNGKIINLSSQAHAMLNDKSPTLEHYMKPDLTTYNSFKQYSFSKICNIWFTRKLQQKLWEDNATTATTYSVHPGIVYTELARSSNKIIKYCYSIIGSMIFKTSDAGAATSLMLVATPKEYLKPGVYYVDCKPFEVDPLALNPQYADELWDISENVIKPYEA